MATLKQHYRGENGKLYRSGTEQEKVPKEAKLEIGTAKDHVMPTATPGAGTGVNTGDAGSGASNVPTGAEATKLTADATTGSPPPAVPNDTRTELPTGFPARALLIKAGFDTMEKVDAADDKTLIDIQGVGAETLKQIREAIK